ncbi:MAG: hypothetical protein HQL77_08770 [Magnetococcales bacterium]|nr:hypothetical protein [Magnetococcales bacterium]
MIIHKTNPNDLQKIEQQLNEANRETLLKFAQFLLQQEQTSTSPESPPREPLNIPSPANETVVQALKRLKKSYPMIEADIGLLDAASQFVMQKVLGHPDAELIRKMEKLFLDAYEKWRQTQGA